MTSPRRTWTVTLAVVGSITLLWWYTARLDEDWALWRKYSAATATTNVIGSFVIVALGYALSAPRSTALRLARTVALGMSLVIVLGILEMPALVLRYDYGPLLGVAETDTWLQLATGVNRRDKDLVHIHQPHKRYRGVVEGNLVRRLGVPQPVGYDVDVAYDGNGFRNDRDLERADIVAVGDSFVEGAEMPVEVIVTSVIGRQLGVTVANLGQSAYGPQQELIALERYGAPLEPRVIVWFFFGGNDLADTDLYEQRQKNPDDYLLRPLASRLFTTNALRAIARLTTPARRVAAEAARRHAVTFARSDGQQETLYLDANEGPWTSNQWDATTAALQRAKRLADEKTATLLVVFIPRKFRVYRGFITWAPGSVVDEWHPNNLPDVLGDWCRAQGIEFLDSTVPLRAAVAAGESVYLPDDVHWNPAGHRVVGEAVASRIQSMVRAPAATGPATR